jgi:hypothetical protein
MGEGAGHVLARRRHAERRGQRPAQRLQEQGPLPLRHDALLLVVRFIQSVGSILHELPLVAARHVLPFARAAVCSVAIVDALLFLGATAANGIAIATGASHRHFQEMWYREQKATRDDQAFDGVLSRTGTWRRRMTLLMGRGSARQKLWNWKTVLILLVQANTVLFYGMYNVAYFCFLLVWVRVENGQPQW